MVARVKPQMDYADYEMKLKARNKDAFGHEVPDPTPIAPPIGFKEFPSMIEQVQSMIRNYNLQKELAAQGVETFEEANDFDVDEDRDSHLYDDVDEDNFLPADIDRGSLPTGEGKGQGEKEEPASAGEEDPGTGDDAPAGSGGGDDARVSPAPKKRK